MSKQSNQRYRKEKEKNQNIKMIIAIKIKRLIIVVINKVKNNKLINSPKRTYFCFILRNYMI